MPQPPGGVVEGQIFLAPLPADFGDNLPRVNIPTGQWKDGLFDIFNAGVFHPSVVCGFCFTQGEFHSTKTVVTPMLCPYTLSNSDFNSSSVQLEWDNSCRGYA